MKKYIIISPLALLFALSANATTIKSDTNASSITDFSTATTVFDASGATGKTITLTVDATKGDVTAYKFSSSQAGTTNKILINGTSEYGLNIFKFTSTTTIFTGKDTSTIFEVNGTGPFTMSSTKEQTLASKATLTFNVDYSSNKVSGAAAEINFYGNKTTIKEQYSGKDNNIVTFGDGVNASTSSTGALSMWGTKAKATISKFHTMTLDKGLRSASSGSLSKYNQTLIVDGIVNANGSTTSTSSATDILGTTVSRSFGLLLNDVTIGVGGAINQNSTNELVNSIKGAFVNSGTLKTIKNVYFSDGATITLNKDSKLQIAGATTTKTSYLDIANIVVTQAALTDNPDTDNASRPVAAYITDSCVSGANVTFNVVSDTDIGGFNIYKDSVLTLNFAENTSLKVEAFKFIDVDGSTVSHTTDFSEGDFAIKVIGNTDKESLFISGMTAEQIDNIKWLDKDEKDLEYSLRAVDGGIYVVVPEPAQWACILGAMAIAFAFMRRRARK